LDPSLLKQAIVADPKFAMAYARDGHPYIVNWDLLVRPKKEELSQESIERERRTSERERLYSLPTYMPTVAVGEGGKSPMNSTSRPTLEM